MPILYDLTSDPLANTSIRKAGMFTTMRVSVGTALGPDNIVGSVSLAAEACTGTVMGTVSVWTIPGEGLGPATAICDTLAPRLHAARRPARATRANKVFEFSLIMM